MLILRMIRNAISTLFLLVTLTVMAVRFAPYYLPPESQILMQDALAKVIALATGKPQMAPSRVGASTPNDFVGTAQDDLMRQLDQIRQGLRTAPVQEDLDPAEALPAPKQPRFQPSARPAYGVTAPRNTGAKRVRVGE